jgi:hypothetical protein
MKRARAAINRHESCGGVLHTAILRYRRDSSFEEEPYMSDRTWILTSEGHWVNLAFARSIRVETDPAPASYWIEFGHDDGVRVTGTPESTAAIATFLASRLTSSGTKDGNGMSLEAGYELIKGTLDSISKTLGGAVVPTK